MADLCIDFGSTFVKFFVCEEKRIIFKDKLPFPSPLVNDGVSYEVGIEDIDGVILRIFDTAMPYSPKRCFISVQMHGFIIRDENREFSNYISWKDKRGNVESPYIDGIDFQLCGTSLKRNLPAVKLLGKEFAKGCELFTLGSYISYKLTERNETHKTDGCATGFFNAQTLHPLEIKNLTLPTVRHSVCAVGSYRGVRIYTPVGDHQASYLGCGAEEEAYLLNIGTATQLSTVCECANISNKKLEARPYFNEKRLLTITNLTGGEALFASNSTDALLRDVAQAIEELPYRGKMTVGGGGAAQAYCDVKKFCELHGIECVLAEDEIGSAGLMKLCELTQTKIGTMLSEIPFSNIPIIFKNCGLDFLIVDAEHGAFDYTPLSSLITTARLVGLTAIVRLSDGERRDITRLADMGADGFILPMTNSAEDIRKVVEYAKYAPIGNRGISTNRAHTFYNPPPMATYMRAANKRIKVFAQIETKSGVENIDGILSTEGVDGVFVGPNDLSISLGCVGCDEPIKQAISTVADSAKRHGKPWGIITTSSTLIAHSLSCDTSFISYGSEINMIKDSCNSIRRKIYVRENND